LRSAKPPQPRDLDLVVGSADSSLLFDLTIKAALYARAGIAEYWILDVIGRRLLVHRNPVDEQYGSVISYSEQESVAPLAAPDSSLPVNAVFPE
jgi:Uma2 family endonuclease